jgi:hypothetical protein
VEEDRKAIMMKTNYNNLSLFESCAIFMAALGMLLIGIQIYLILPGENQIQVAGAFNLLDVHESFAQAQVTTQFVTGTMDDFYKQFDIAFTELFSFPDTVGTPVIKFADAIGNYSDSVGTGYAQNNLRPSEGLGEILGAYMTAQNIQPVEPAGSLYVKSQQINKKYYYHAPTMVQKLIK